MGYLMDKEWLITTIVGGAFGGRIDTPISRPYFDNTGWVEYERSRWGPLGEDLGNYPYEYNPSAAAALLDEMGFVQGTTPNPNYDPSLPWSAPFLRIMPAKVPVYASAVWHLAALAPGGVNRVYKDYVPGEGDFVGGNVVINLPWPVHGDWTVCRRLRVYYTPEPGTPGRRMVELVKGVDYTYNPGTGQVTITGCTPNPAWWPPTVSSLFTIRWQRCERDVPAEVAEQDLLPLIAYLRSDHTPRLEAGRWLATHLKKIGVPIDQREGTSGFCYYPVMNDMRYHFYTGGWSMGRYPTHFYSMYTEDGIFPQGPNYPQIRDDAITYWAKKQYFYPMDAYESIMAAKACQMLLVDSCNIIWLYSGKGYYAYKSGWLGVVTTAGYGTGRAWDYMFFNLYNEDPNVKQVRYGLLRPPEELNPIFSSWLWDYQVLDQIYAGMMNANPVKPSIPGKSPAGSDQPWIAKDWKYEWLDDNGNGLVDEGDRSKVTYWFEGSNGVLDVYFHGNGSLAPWKVTLEDIVYTHWLTHAWMDLAWNFDAVVNLIDIIAYSTEMKIEFYYSAPGFWSLYWVLGPLPKRVIDAFPIDPGHSNAYFPLGAPDPRTGAYGGMGNLPLEATLIGTGMWKYRAGSMVWGAGGSVILDANRQFFLEGLMGDIDFAYYFASGPQPQGGSYKVALADLVILAKAYGSKGNCDPAAGNTASPNWNPACDMAKPSCVVGLADLVTLAKVYGQEWGHYDREKYEN
jgi:hypothetical protein